MESGHSIFRAKKKEHTGLWRKSESSNKTKEHLKGLKSDPTANNKKTKKEPSSEKLPRKASNRSFGQVIAPITRRTAGFTRTASFSLKKKRHDQTFTATNYEQRSPADQFFRDPQQCVSNVCKTQGRHAHWTDGSIGHGSRTYTEFDQWEIDVPEIAIQDYSTFHDGDVEDQTDYFRQARWAIQLLEANLEHDLHEPVALRQKKPCQAIEDDASKIDICTGSTENEESDFKRGLNSLIYPISAGAATIVQKSSRVADLTNRLFRSMRIDIIRKRRALTPRQENSEVNNTVTLDNNDRLWNKMGSFSKGDKERTRMSLQD